MQFENVISLGRPRHFNFLANRLHYTDIYVGIVQGVLDAMVGVRAVPAEPKYPGPKRVWDSSKGFWALSSRANSFYRLTKKLL